MWYLVGGILLGFVGGAGAMILVFQAAIRRALARGLGW